MSAGSIRQIKLSSGEEIICEIMNWKDDHGMELVVRKIMSLKFEEFVDAKKKPIKKYTFNGFFVYQEDPLSLIILNTQHIIAVAFPAKELLVQYNISLKSMEASMASREEYGDDDEEVEEQRKDIKESHDYLNGLVDEEDIDISLAKKTEGIHIGDSDNKKILNFEDFKNKNIIH
jgi:hypothetical protein